MANDMVKRRAEIDNLRSSLTIAQTDSAKLREEVSHLMQVASEAQARLAEEVSNLGS